MKQPLFFPAQPAAAHACARRTSMLDVCAALLLTLAGLLGREGIPHGE